MKPCPVFAVSTRITIALCITLLLLPSSFSPPSPVASHRPHLTRVDLNQQGQWCKRQLLAISDSLHKPSHARGVQHPPSERSFSRVTSSLKKPKKFAISVVLKPVLYMYPIPPVHTCTLSPLYIYVPCPPCTYLYPTPCTYTVQYCM